MKHACFVCRFQPLSICGVLTLAVLASPLTIATPPAQAQTEIVLHSFTGQPDGEYPSATLVLDAKGNLYGTTDGGGAYDSSSGTVFEVTPSGVETVLYNFGAQDGDGSQPTAGLLRAGGDLFGTTSMGGANGSGTVFEVTPTRGEKVLVSFGANDGGGYPEAVMVRDLQHNLYGTTSGFNGAYGNGAIFEVSPTGALTILY